MTANVLRRGAIALAAYIAAFLGILFIQFSNSSNFILSLGALKINGSERPGQDGAKTPEEPLLVSTDGITFFIDKKTPLAAVLDTGEEVALEMLSFNKEENAFSVEFDRDVTLSFLPGGVEGEGGASIYASIPQDISLLRLGYRLDRGAAAENVSGTLMVHAASGLYTLKGASLEDGYSDGAQARVEIRAESPLAAYMKYQIVRNVSLAAIAEDASASEEAYGQAVERFAESIMRAWQAAGQGSLTEELAAAYLAESGKRGNYSAALNSMPASFLNSSSRSYITSVYLGNIEANWTRWQQENQREATSYAQSLETGSPAVFEKKNLAAFLIANRRTADFNRLVEIASVCARRDTLTPRQAAGVLELSLDRALLSLPFPAISDEVIAVCEEAIRKSLRYLPASSSAPSSLYIEESEGEGETTSVLETAAILYRWGSQRSGNADWVAAARLIAATALGMAESGAALPASIAIPDPAMQANEEEEEAQSISLASVYPLVEPVSSWYPHSVAVHPEYFIWTCAANVSLSSPAQGIIDIAADFPVEMSHYMIVSGIQDFYGIQIHDMDYRSDPRFESYNASGYRYNADTGTLFLKVRHRTGRETIRIFTAPPEGRGELPQEGGEPAASPTP